MARHAQPIKTCTRTGPAAAGAVFALILAALAAVATQADWPVRFGAADWTALRFTVWQAVLSALFSVIFAIPVARALARRRFAGRRILVTLLGAPFILPVIVAVMGLLVVFGRAGWVSQGLALFGLPPLSIYVNELIREFGAKPLIRIGSCGAMQQNVGLRDIVLPQTASSISTPSSALFRDVKFAPCADFTLLRAAEAEARARGITPHVGSIYSTDTFYDERPDLNDVRTRHGCLAVEMDSAERCTLAARYGARAMSVLTVSDHLLTEEALPSEARENSFGDMVEIALEAAFA